MYGSLDRPVDELDRQVLENKCDCASVKWTDNEELLELWSLMSVIV